MKKADSVNMSFCSRNSVGPVEATVKGNGGKINSTALTKHSEMFI